MDPKMQKRKEDFLRNYKEFRRQAREYIQANKLEENLYKLIINFEVDQVQYEIVLVLNLVRDLPLKDDIHFRFASNSKMFEHVLTMAGLQNQFIISDAELLGNSKVLEGLQEIQKNYSDKHPLVLNASLQKGVGQDSAKNNTIEYLASTEDCASPGSRNNSIAAVGQEPSVCIDPRLLEEIVEASEESLFSRVSTIKRNHEEFHAAKTRVQLFMNQFMDKQISLLRAIRLVSFEVNSLPEWFQLKVLYRLRAAFAEMKAAVTYLRSVFAFQLMLANL